MEFVFLGTSSGAPTKDRNVTGLALSQGRGWDLFDCGEGTQHRILGCRLSLHKLRRIFISHLHGDHCFGLFGLLGSRSMGGATGPLKIYGPRGLEAMVRAVLSASSSYITYPLEFHEVGADGGQVVKDAAETIDAVPLDHRVESFAWWIREGTRPGAFDAERAATLGVPKGPLFGQLQRGGSVTLADGTVVTAESVVGPSRPGRTVIIGGDNRDPARLLDTTGSVQMLVHEATYTEAVLDGGEDQGHSTAHRVASAAERHGVANLVLTHFSPRFGPEGAAQSITEVRDEAAAVFTGTLHLAADYDELSLSSAGELSVRERQDPNA